MSTSAVDYLLSRRSVKFVQAPAPSEQQLEQILQAAMSAPDHGRLRPWRFSLIQGDAIMKLADLSIEATRRAGKPLTDEKEASIRKWLSKVPLLIAIACRIDHSNTRIPEHERMLAVGAAVMNMLNAIHMQGYGAFWSTGLGTYVDEVNEALGFDGLDYRFMGYLAVGTPIEPATAAPERPDFKEFVTEWK
ncbi:nitroreductase [Pusillimonas sp. DMV24BSW_D]|uniref:nitroreductase family protein n=1 Tax=Neopusillimonas aestuarii TaxID=2716226 RepID=UPI001408B001|nr:nitroreductase [Pusillimonas sp. DMV24BSW_D]QIM49670.1 nitroreductase [Pusillimonas sp. DMV24BSW_D]